MKKIQALALAWALLIALCACGPKPPAQAPEAGSGDQTDYAGLPAPGTDPAKQAPEDFIRPALDVFSWFAVAPLEADMAQVKQAPLETGGEPVDWFRVKDTRLDTYQKLSAYVRNFFDEEITGQLMSNGVYRDIDGYLYNTQGGRGTNITIEGEHFDIIDMNEDTVRFEVAVSYTADSGEPENPKILEFVMKKQNGKWVFTEFPFYL